tara:strand:+ start:5377 stop:6216 length:840 start_codon:yes stop_codon:yes gene_type:complete
MQKKKGTPTLITEQILRLMQTSGTDWQKPWRNKRFITVRGHILQGNNVVTLASLSDFDRSVWGTYDQWKSVNCQVKKGAKSVRLTVYKGLDDNNQPTFGKYIAFNIEQVEGDKSKFDSFDTIDCNKEEKLEEIEQLIKKCNIKFQWGSDIACYCPSTDTISMPDFKSFSSQGGYYATLFHEKGHRTGHKSRLDRDLKGKFGDKKYAMEELIAELTACFVSIALEVESEPRPDHAQYLNSWIRLLKDDKRAFNIATSKAQQATNYILNEMGVKVQELEVA